MLWPGPIYWGQTSSKPPGWRSPVWWEGLLGWWSADEIWWTSSGCTRMCSCGIVHVRNWLVQPTTYHQIFQLVFMKLFCFRINKSKKGHLLPLISDPSEGDEHSNTVLYSHHDPKDNQPYGDRWLVRESQRRLNPQKLQAVVIRLEGIIDTVPAQPIPKAKHSGKRKRCSDLLPISLSPKVW